MALDPLGTAIAIACSFSPVMLAVAPPGMVREVKSICAVLLASVNANETALVAGDEVVSVVAIWIDGLSTASCEPLTMPVEIVSFAESA